MKLATFTHDGTTRVGVWWATRSSTWAQAR